MASISKHSITARLAMSAALLLAGIPTVLLAAPETPGVASGGLAGILAFGFVLGLKHALDADHLVAVGTMISEHNSARRAAAIGFMWGAGHTTSLLVAGVAIVLLRPSIPATLGPILELAVAAMIIALGVALLARVFRRGGARLSAHRHSHGSLEHWHPHLHYGPAEVGNVPGTHHHPVAAGRRPFLVGMMHGLAGSATLVLLVLAELPTPLLGILYLLVFGIGSIAGMMIMSLAVALPYRIVARRFARVEHGLRLAAALLGIAVGVMMVYQIGVVDGLFRAAAGLL